ncbi:class I tRNA ligase family protein [Leisingera methylohalidivorans]|uniref:Methionyl-tRNA synthetase n=1 Tax=Leisingera methylohalidivorans DSM 14336 TaxID=999552 RepID=V9VWL6_9RHOB|nr:class I tRNA ligase family protein [Leisingera methylohalidivorans]AHD02119.1 methionyl-tRNA synthetase [Leisingera methylohalidivorans DSM 14336]
MKPAAATPDFIVTLPPPTPNGGLHVGHMAGPFLAADIFAKAAQAGGRSVHVLSFSDTNQSYVRATAEKQNRDPAELASGWTRDILNTLEIYGCQVDNYFEPGPASDGFVRDTLLRLYEAGVLKKKSFPFMYLPDEDQFLDEAGASGLCPRCLDDCKCGICEACGFPTQADTLLNPRSTNDPSARVEVRHAEVLVLELETWRDVLRRFHSFGDAIRPKYRWLVDDALAGPLPDFPVTVPGSWGIEAGHPDLPGQVVNAWPELALNFVHGYKQAASAGGTPKIVNFFGYDNSYFYAIVHVALLHAAGMEQFLPHATVINEFYNLENAKFSTSRGHLIWARDIAADYPADLVRFYTALSAPGFEQGNFNAQDMEEVIERRLLAPYRRIAAAAAAAGQGAGLPETAAGAAAVMEARVAASFSLERFNLRQGAEDVLKGLGAIESFQAAPGAGRDSVMQMLGAWARAAAPLMPSVASGLLRALEAGRMPGELAGQGAAGDAAARSEEPEHA